MEQTPFEPRVIEEQRLIGTLITGRPDKSSFIASLITFLVMAGLSQLYWSNAFNWADKLPAVGEKIFIDGEWWRIFTAIFIHADFGHFLSNMYMLCIFCFFIFGYFGFRVYPLAAIVVAALVNTLAVVTYDSETRLLGASGLVYVLGGFWLCLYFLIQRQYSWGSRLLRVTGIALMVFWPTTFVPTTSYRTHAIGFALGVLWGIFYFQKNRGWIRSRERHKVIYAEPEPELVM